jgi:hypothetical protein
VETQWGGGGGGGGVKPQSLTHLWQIPHLQHPPAYSHTLPYTVLSSVKSCVAPASAAVSCVVGAGCGCPATNMHLPRQVGSGLMLVGLSSAW